MVSDKVYKLCTSGETISSHLAQTPTKTPGDLARHLFSSNNLHSVEAPGAKYRAVASREDLEKASKCGNFGNTDPSLLFLRAFNDVLGTLEHDSLAGICSPSLMGSTGVVPLCVIGPLNDICRHMSNLIVRAKKEVLLATNYWMASGASGLITDALLELSRRHEGSDKKVPVKIMYDRGNVKQFLENHQNVLEKEYTGKNVQLPSPDQIPNIDLRVVNFHKPMLGTFHAKFMIVDREIAITQSNNIQDNDNVEMMAQLEGPIVDSMWEVFLVSWHNAIQPLATMNERAADKPLSTFSTASFKSLFTPEGLFRLPDEKPWDNSLPEHVAGSPHYDQDIAGEIDRMHATLSPRTPGETQPEILARHLNQPTKLAVKPTAPPPSSNSLHFFPMVPLPPHTPVPIAVVGRKPFGAPAHTSLHVPQNEAFLSLIHHAEDTIFIQTPDLNASPLPDAILAAVRRGVVVTYYVCLGYNDAGELLPGQNGTNEMFAHSLFEALGKEPGKGTVQEARDRLRVHYYVAKDQDHPIHNKFKQRSCHIKLMIVDGHVAVQGSGNQDTQSWWQSQEVNIMVDSPIICKSWREAIERNQNTGMVAPGTGEMGHSTQVDHPGQLASNTHSVDPAADANSVSTAADAHMANVSGPPPLRAYGRADYDGLWRDRKTGEVAEGSLGVDPGKFAWAKGILGAVNRARGAGGF